MHAHAIYTECLGIGSPMDLAKAMARSLLADRMTSFNRREITHSCRAFRSAPEWQRTAALTTLEDFAWIEGDTFLPQHGGRWAVNPQVHDVYANEAATARARRNQVRDALIGDTA